MWKRMVCYEKQLKLKSFPLSNFENEPHLIEWDQWVFQNTKKRVIIKSVNAIGNKLLLRKLIYVWKNTYKNLQRNFLNRINQIC